MRTFRGGVAEVRRHHVLGLILVVALLYGMASEGWDRLSDLKVVTGVGLDPAGGTRTFLALGVLELGRCSLGLGLLTYVKRKVHLHGHAHIARILSVIDAAMFVAVDRVRPDREPRRRARRRRGSSVACGASASPS